MNKSKVDFMKVLVSALFFEKSSSGDNPLGDYVSLKNRKFFEMSLKSQNWFIGNNVSTYYYYYYHFVVLQKPTPSKYFGSSLFLFFCGIWSCMQNSWWVIHLASSCSRSQLVTWSLSLMESFFNCRQSQLKASAQIQHYWQASNFACMLFTLSNVPFCSEVYVALVHFEVTTFTYLIPLSDLRRWMVSPVPFFKKATKNCRWHSTFDLDFIKLILINPLNSFLNSI